MSSPDFVRDNRRVWGEAGGGGGGQTSEPYFSTQNIRGWGFFFQFSISERCVSLICY